MDYTPLTSLGLAVESPIILPQSIINRVIKEFLKVGGIREATIHRAIEMG